MGEGKKRDGNGTRMWGGGGGGGLMILASLVVLQLPSGVVL